MAVLFEIAPSEAPANRLEKRGKITTTAKPVVWLASISIRFWMIGDAKRLPAEVPRGRSFFDEKTKKGLKLRGAKKHTH